MLSGWPQRQLVYQMCGSTPLPNTLPFTVFEWRDTAGNTHTGTPPSVGAAPISDDVAPPA